jgi:putative transcriptional regulator
MSKKAFDKILAGIESAMDPKAEARVTRFPTTQADVKRTRMRLGLSQEEFARGFCISLGTLRHWEQGLRKPDGPARVLLHVIDKDPEHVIAAIWPDAQR